MISNRLGLLTLTVPLLALACESGSSQAAPVPAVVSAGGAEAAPAPPPEAEPEAEPATIEAEAAPEAAGAAPPEAEPAPLRGVEPEDKKVLIVGSSLAATGFGVLLEKAIDAHPHVECHRKAKSATGLARPDFFDWDATVSKELAARDPNLTIVVMGGNDGQDLVPRSKKDKRVHWDTEEWASAYRMRVDAFLTLLTEGEREVLWLGIPRTNTTKLEAKLATIREIQIAAVDANPRAHYLDLTQFIEDEEGVLLKQTAVKGKQQTMRGDDGVHFTMSGSQYLADKVYPEVLSTLGISEAEDEASGEAPAH